MNHDLYDDEYIRSILLSVKTIAMVGASDDDSRPSHFVFKYLLERGYTVYPVNPRLVDKGLMGHKAYASVREVPLPLDMVEIFRGGHHAMSYVEDAIAMGAKIVWMQLGVRNDEAAAVAEAAGLKVVMNRCPKIEYGRFSREISWQGINSRMITSKKPLLVKGKSQQFGLVSAFAKRVSPDKAD
jgi:uncharacterized protein